jgi:hypothetical protein
MISHNYPEMNTLKFQTFAAVGLLAFFALTQSASAHHAPSAVFDMDHRFTLAGVCSKVEWINPHILLHLDVKDASGKVANWTFESNPPLWFKKAGVQRQDVTKAVGQNITIDGLRAKDGTNYGYFLKITFADGKTLEWNSLMDQAFGQKTDAAH